MKGANTGAAMLTGGLLGLGLAAVCLGLVLPRALSISGTSLSVSSSREDGQSRAHIKWSGGGRSLEIWARGAVHFTPDFTDVESISRGGLFKLRERRGLKFRSMRFTPDGDGGLERTFYAAGFSVHDDDEAREWLTRVLPEAVDKTGFGAEARARKMLEEQGLEGVLQRVTEVETDHVRQIYYRTAVKEGDLEARDLERLVRHLAHEIDSDHTKHSLLKWIADEHDGAKRISDALLDAVMTIDSDHYKSTILIHLVRDAPISGSFFAAIGEIHSDHYRQKVLNRVVKNSDLDGALLALALDTAADIDSDHYRTQFLLSVAGDLHEQPAAQTSFFEVLDGLRSDHYRHQTLTKIIGESDLDAGLSSSILRTTRPIDSDHYKTQVLVRLAPELPASEEVLTQYVKVAGTLDSSHYLNQALQELLLRPDLDEPVLKEMLSTVKEGVSGAQHRGRLVEQIADRLIE